MIEIPDTTYNEATDGMIPIVPGIYPAHVAALESRDLDTKAGEQTVFNITFLIADEVTKTTVAKLVKNGDGKLVQDMDGNGKPSTVSAAFMKSKRFNSRGIWLTPNPSQGQGWRNRNYKEFFENLGVDFPKNGDGNVSLALVEESDVIGHPCFVKLQREQYEKDGEVRFVWKVFDVFPWTDGKLLPAAEVKEDDLPF